MPTTPAVRNRVQVVPLGFEYARLKMPIQHWKADIVVALEYAGSDRPIPYVQRLLTELEETDRIDLDRRSCDIFDLYDALGTMTESITDYASGDVFVNLSAGSKITAIAGMIACMATEATPLYARPDYGPDGERIPDEPLHDEVAEVFELPAYPIDRPSDMHIAVLVRIDRSRGTSDSTSGRYRGVSKTTLIDFALESEFDFVARSQASTRKGYYRLLDRHVVDPLTDAGYITTTAVGREKYVSLTPSGENALRAFRHLIEVDA